MDEAESAILTEEKVIEEVPHPPSQWFCKD